MKKLLLIAALIVAFLIPMAGWAAELNNITAAGVDGNLVYKDKSGNIITKWHATDREMSIPSGSKIAVESGGTIDIESGGYLKINNTAVTATAATLNMVPADGTIGQYMTTDGAGTWSWGAGTSGTLDQAYNAGISITVDAGAVALTNNAADNNGVLTLEKTPVGAQSGDILTVTAGANLTGDAIQITNAGTGKDINGTGNLWSVSKAGLGTFVGLTATGSITMSGGVIAGASPLVFDGATPEATNRVTVAITDPTAARTLTIPDATGSVKLNATATKNWAGAHADWTLSVNEQEASFITGTNADAGVNVLLSAAKPGSCYFVHNASGQIITFKVTGQTGGTIANNKRAYYCSDATDLYEIWEQS